ncbi:35381_t:CDS:2, partial [Racocetra persica]
MRILKPDLKITDLDFDDGISCSDKVILRSISARLRWYLDSRLSIFFPLSILGRDTLPKEIIGPFEFGEFREIEKSLDSNEMLEEGKALLEIFRKNKNKIPYCK